MYGEGGFSTAFKSFREDGLNQLPSSLLSQIEESEAESSKEVETRQICKNFVAYKKYSSYYFILTSILIIIYNSFFYTFTYPVISMIGYHTRTEENSVVSQMIIVCLVIDMILLPFMIGMNLIEYGSVKVNFLSFFNTGKHTDFGAEWYSDIGKQLMITMIVFSLQPFIDFLTESLVLKGCRSCKRRFVYGRIKQSDQSKDNVRNDYLKFLDLQAGPTYDFYYKCAYVNMVVIITLIFGPVYPMLYLIGAMSLANFYFMERLMLTYFYRIPPKFSEDLTI